MSGLCQKAYRKGGKRGKIYCTVSGIVCAHQYWCGMAVEFRHTAGVDNCPGKNKEKTEKKRD